MTSQASEKITGWVDARLRPLILVRFGGATEVSMPGLVDTGFNGELLLPEDLIGRIPHTLLGVRERIDTAAGSPVVTRAISHIVWFGSFVEVDVWITPTTQRFKDPVPLLIGTRLLSGLRLTVDFSEGLVSIQKV